MFLRDVLKRRSDRAAGAERAAELAPTAMSLLAEVAADPEDFVDLARVLRLDLGAVIETLVTARPATPAALVVELTARARALPAVVEAIAAERAPSRTAIGESSWGGREVGWGRWARVHGDARVHRERLERNLQTALRTVVMAP